MIRYIALCGRDRQENSQMLRGLAPLKKRGGLEFVCFESSRTLLDEYARGRRFDLILLDVGEDGPFPATAPGPAVIWCAPSPVHCCRRRSGRR